MRLLKRLVNLMLLMLLDMNKFNLKFVFDVALQGLKVNRGRTFLTALGVFIGIATIVVVLGAGHALEGFVNKQMAVFGSDTIEVETKIPSVSDVEMAASLIGGAEVTSLKLDDFEALKKLSNVKDFYAGVFGQFKAVYRNKSKRSMIYAVTASLQDIDAKLEMDVGRFFSRREEQAQAHVVVLGADVKRDLFGDEDAVSKVIKINHLNFKVIGVAKKRGNVAFFNFDKMIYVPLLTAQKQLLGIDHVVFGLLSIRDLGKVDETVYEINSVLARRHHIGFDDVLKWDFRTTSMKDAMKVMQAVTFGIVVLVFFIAGISLVVGGVGIMNVMYLSVVERTREIGIRKAIGATSLLIQLQFLFEAVLITVIGGIGGILFGGVVILLLDLFLFFNGFDFFIFIGVDSVVIGFVFALIFGVLFGLYPARKAGKMSPVEALRSE